MTVSLCSRCTVRPRVRGQRWCQPCRAEYKRVARGTRPGTGEQVGNSAETHSAVSPRNQSVGPGKGVVRPRQAASEKSRLPAPAPPAPYIPFTGAGVPREPWYAAFLSDLAVNGGISLAAAAAGVHRSRVSRRMDDDPAFAAEVEVAKGYYRELLEWESVNLARRKDNPLPYFARLKAELPTRYIDRQAVFLATNPGTLSAEDGKVLLQAMFGHARADETGCEGQADAPALAESDGSPATS
jgi:hypothetical protein